MRVPIHSIVVRDRFRRDMGDLDGLAASIAAQGLLQPIGVTEDNVLVFGGRRLQACRDILKWGEIEVRRVSVTSIVEGEYAENEVRKDFTISERVAIGKAIEEALGERRGRLARNPQNVAGLADKPQGETRELAAKKAGFGNHTTYEAAKKVIETAVPGLIEALDQGAVSVAAAALVAEQPVPEQPVPEQTRFVQVAKTEQKKAIRNFRELREARKQPLDELDELMKVAVAFESVFRAQISPESLVAKAFPYTLRKLAEHAVRVAAFLRAIEKAQPHDQARAS